MQPGRSCPLHYRYSPRDLSRAPDFRAGTLYVVGGLYGNIPALQALCDMAARESATLVFNGDFNWFNIDDAGFREINCAVLGHHALRGNVETEIAGEDDGAGCGCAYPDTVSQAEVERSNAILSQLRDTARRHPDLRTRLAALPMHMVAQVGNTRVAIVHGDLESLAGWSLSAENLHTSEAEKIIQKQLLASNCPIVASSHTCLPVALTFESNLGNSAVFNNGAAGMPNFRDTQFGVVTRISTTPALLVTPLYGTNISNVYIEALPVFYDAGRWQHEFVTQWPPDSAAHVSYYHRIVHGPAYAVRDANRLTVSNTVSTLPMITT